MNINKIPAHKTSDIHGRRLPPELYDDDGPERIMLNKPRDYSII